MDHIKSMGYHYSTVAAITISVSDMEIPKSKPEIIAKANELVDKYQTAYRRGLMSNEERYEKVIQTWNVTTEKIADELMDELRKNTEEGPHFFPDDTLTDQPERAIAAEVIREKILRNMRDEIPHGTAVDIEKMREREGSGMLDIEATIYCEKESHKGMIIGRGGAMLKKIASEARTDLETFLDTKVNLKCWVKVRDDWRNNENAIKQVGLRYEE